MNSVRLMVTTKEMLTVGTDKEDGGILFFEVLNNGDLVDKKSKEYFQFLDARNGLMYYVANGKKA